MSIGFGKLLLLFGTLAVEQTGRLTGRVLDEATGKMIPCRLYIQSGSGHWHFAKSAVPEGSAFRYEKVARRNTHSVEMHTTLSAHPFVVDLPPGQFTLTAERGKEYAPTTLTVKVANEPATAILKLRRWFNAGERGWYSGDTHVHRSLDELPNVLLAEDLNVAFPLTQWVADAYVAPAKSALSARQNIEPRLIEVDRTHVYWPLNTEYELTRVDGRSFVLGAFFVLNHNRPFDLGAPPVAPVAGRCRTEHALIELDKHNWPWSMMLVPVMNVDLFELSNNHVWRTEFGFPDFGEPAPPFMNIERNERGYTERGWIEYGLQNYYALLNCGFRLRPTAGTASGVHPVPLGYGRVYVHLPGGFRYEDWVAGLNAGRSFVTTGPMLFVTVNDQPPGHIIHQETARRTSYRIRGTVVSSRPLRAIEIVRNGMLTHRIDPANNQHGLAWESPMDVSIELDESSWIAVRCWEPRGDGREAFAHSSPVHVEVADAPVRPRKVEIEFLIDAMQDRLARTAGVFPEPVRDEYRKALETYRRIASRAR